MTATDELRRLLDERGVEWESKDVEGVSCFHDTRWNAYDVQWCYVEFVGNNYTKLKPSSEFHCTPEQAIAATLGSGTLTAEQVSKATYAHSIHADCADADWQAIADELNSRAERTCHIVKNSRKYVLSDGRELFDDGCSICNGYVGDGDNYCSNCGARVVGE